MKKANRSVVAQKRWIRDSDKELYWRTKISEWKKSGLSIRAFCQKHEIVETSFYAWRREIAIRDREASRMNVSSIDADVPETVKDSRGRLIPVRFREHQQLPAGAQTNANEPAFVQLKLAPNAAANEKRSSSVDVVCPNGFVLRIDQDVNLDFVSRVINALE